MSHDHNAILKREVIAYWNRSPENRPVKVVGIVREQKKIDDSKKDNEPKFWIEGYITCFKFIRGQTLSETERILGLNTGELSAGAYFYEFLRLPTSEEFNLRGYSQCPDGIPWTPKSKYPAGRGAAQWQIKENTFIPSRLAAIVNPDQKLPQ